MEPTRLTAFSDDLFNAHPKRFSRREKDAFLARCTEEFKSLGYTDEEIFVHKTKINKNLVVGARDAEILVTAHYDTPARNGFLFSAAPLVGLAGANLVFMFVAFAIFIPCISLLTNVLATVIDKIDLPFFLTVPAAIIISFLPLLLFLPLFLIKNPQNRNDNTSGCIGVVGIAALVAENPELRKKCAFILFDNEEWMLLGSAAYKKWRVKTGTFGKIKKMINLDCIGNGEKLLFAAPTRHNELQRMSEFFKSEDFDLTTKKSIIIFTSDHAHFPCGIMVSFAKRSKLGPLYLPRIHTGRDTVCDVENIGRLCGSVYRYISS
jgi:hypothetical protein